MMWLVLRWYLVPHQWAYSLPGDMLICQVTDISPREGEEQASWASAFSKKQYCFSSESRTLTWGQEVFVVGLALLKEGVGQLVLWLSPPVKELIDPAPPVTSRKTELLSVCHHSSALSWESFSVQFNLESDPARH